MVKLILILVNVQFLRNVVSSFEKGGIVKITPRQIPESQWKISSTAKFSIAFTWGNFHLPLNGIWKKPELFICMTRGFLKKITKVKITFVYMLRTIMIKKSLEQTMKHKTA